MASPLVAALMDPNNIGMSEADHGGFGSTADKLKQGFIGKVFHGLATLPARAGQAAVDYGDPLKGTYDPAPIMEGAMTAITGGMPFAQAGALGSAGGKGIRAYHGSANQIDNFDRPAYFSPSRDIAAKHGANVHEVDIAAKNPLYTPDQMLVEGLRSFPDRAAELRKAGHDAVIFSGSKERMEPFQGLGGYIQPQIYALDPSIVSKVKQQ
jgi:hypothetical protein